MYNEVFFYTVRVTQTQVWIGLKGNAMALNRRNLLFSTIWPLYFINILRLSMLLYTIFFGAWLSYWSETQDCKKLIQYLKNDTWDKVFYSCEMQISIKVLFCTPHLAAWVLSQQQNLLNQALTKLATVIASLFHRICYHSTALRIHVSPECKAVLDTLGGFYLEERGPVTLKVVNISFPFYRQII